MVNSFKISLEFYVTQPMTDGTLNFSAGLKPGRDYL